MTLHLFGETGRADSPAELKAKEVDYTLEDYLATAPEPFDLVIGNPPFSAFSKHFWPDLLLRAGALRPAGGICFYGLSQWGQSKNCSARMRRWSPSRQLRLGGRPEHRDSDGQTEAKIPKKLQKPGGPTTEMRDNGGDQREYSGWVWLLDDIAEKLETLTPEWTCRQLLELPRGLLRWSAKAIPGTYPIEPALVDLIRERYL